MHGNKWAAWLALALVLFVTGLACQTSDRILTIAQANTVTPTRTRTVRATFTPQPTVTNTPLPTATPVPPTRTPTRRPTARPATAVPPPPPPAAPKATIPTFQYAVASFKCEHSGGSWLKGHIYTDKNDPNSAEPGVGVVFGGAGGDKYDGPNLSDGNGDFAFVLSPDGYGPRLGTYYIWLVGSTGNRISEMAGPITINGKKETFVDSCWAGWAFFTKNY